MRRNKVVSTVVGARPQFIKAAVVSHALRAEEGLLEVMIHTGQHYDAVMSGRFFDELEIPAPKYDLDVGSGTHGYQTGEIMKRIEPVLVRERPDALIVYGDTNSTLAGALAAVKLKIPVVHVEAGLRSHNREMPEEINRIVTDHVSSMLFCPTETALINLASEGISAGVHKSGDVMYDVALQYGACAERKSRILPEMNLKASDYILTTVHRAENTDSRDRLSSVMEALNDIAGEMNVVMPLHPRTRSTLQQYGLENGFQRIRMIEPVGFLDMMNLIKNAKTVATDSGGLQKEAYFHRVPCVTLRNETEWVETVQAGWNLLADMSSPAAIVRDIRRAVHGEGDRRDIGEYGDGNASADIVGKIAAYLADM